MSILSCAKISVQNRVISHSRPFESDPDIRPRILHGRLPEARFTLFGLMLPVLISLVIPALQCGYDRTPSDTKLMRTGLKSFPWASHIVHLHPAYWRIHRVSVNCPCGGYGNRQKQLREILLWLVDLIYAPRSEVIVGDRQELASAMKEEAKKKKSEDGKK